VPLLVLLCFLAASVNAGTAAACSMKHCQVCEMHPASYTVENNMRTGKVQQCMRAKSGYAVAKDRRSVPGALSFLDLVAATC